MPRGKSKSLKSWERLLIVMLDGKPILKDKIQETINYDFMYRLSSLILEIKLHGGVVRVAKNGRNVISYQLVNCDEMSKYIARRGFSPLQQTGIKKLSDLNAEETINKVINIEHVD